MTPGNPDPVQVGWRLAFSQVKAQFRLAEDRGFEPLRAFTQHAFQLWDEVFWGVRQASLSVKLTSASGFGRVRMRTTETRSETRRGGRTHGHMRLSLPSR